MDEDWGGAGGAWGCAHKAGSAQRGIIFSQSAAIIRKMAARNHQDLDRDLTVLELAIAPSHARDRCMLVVTDEVVWSAAAPTQARTHAPPRDLGMV